MSDVVVTVPMNFTHPNAPGERGLRAWLAEGDAPGQPTTGELWDFTTYGPKVPEIARGERVYVVCQGGVVGYAPLVDLRFRKGPWGQFCIQLIRAGGAVAVSIPERVTGFRGWRYRWWNRSIERPIDLSEFINPRKPIRWGGPATCPRQCGECQGGVHHWLERVPEGIESGEDFDQTDADRAIIAAGLDLVWGCKHCEAWVEMANAPSGRDLDPDVAFQLGMAGKTCADKLPPKKPRPTAKPVEQTGGLFA